MEYRKIEYIQGIIDGKPYRQYTPQLREQFNFSCAYCTITEYESGGSTFHVDHFRPQKEFEYLGRVYKNLRYSCPRCNSYKSSTWLDKKSCTRDCERCINKSCESKGERFIDCMKENPLDYFIINKDYIITPKSNNKPAMYTINHLRLNRLQLKNLRKLRMDLYMWLTELEQLKQQKFQSYKEIERSIQDIEVKILKEKSEYEIHILKIRKCFLKNKFLFYKEILQILDYDYNNIYHITHECRNDGSVII